MTLSDLKVLPGNEFHDRVMYHHLAKWDDTPVYYMDDSDSDGNWYWLTICQDTDNDDGLWRGELDWLGHQFDAYDGCETPEEVLAILMAEVQAYVAEEILAA